MTHIFLFAGECNYNSDCPIDKTCVYGICKGNYLPYFQLELKSYNALTFDT